MTKISRLFLWHDFYKMLAPSHEQHLRPANVPSSDLKSSISNELATYHSSSLPPSRPSHFILNTQSYSPPDQHQLCTYITSNLPHTQRPTRFSHLYTLKTHPSLHPPSSCHKATRYFSLAADAISIRGIFHLVISRKLQEYMGTKTSSDQWKDSSLAHAGDTWG